MSSGAASRQLEPHSQAQRESIALVGIFAHETFVVEHDRHVLVQHSQYAKTDISVSLVLTECRHAERSLQRIAHQLRRYVMSRSAQLSLQLGTNRRDQRSEWNCQRITCLAAQ